MTSKIQALSFPKNKIKETKQELCTCIVCWADITQEDYYNWMYCWDCYSYTFWDILN